jgi:hypothetical protein
MLMIGPGAGFIAAQGLEVTPFTGYRIGGSFEDNLNGVKMDLDDSESYGLIVDVDLSPGKQIELLYSHQSSSVRVSPAFILAPKWDLDVDYFHIGGATTYNNHSQFRPFVAGGIGLTYLDPEQLKSEARLSLSLAGGAKLFLAENTGLRLEVRGYWTFFNGSGAIFCNNGGCQVQARGEAWWQFESNLGVFVRF